MGEADRTEGEQIRLHVFLAHRGVASRRSCEELIKLGRVRVNGKIIKTMGCKINPDKDTVTFDNKKIAPKKQKKVYIALHKPAGYLTSNFDPFNRPLAVNLIKKHMSQRIYHVGRLDFETKGLIFYTNCGDFAQKVSHPSRQIEKEYIVETAKAIPEALLRQFLRGITVDKQVYTCIQYDFINETKVRITLHEGKNREIRRVFSFFNCKIKNLTRTRIGIVNLDGITEGTFRKLTDEEIHFFYS